MQMSLVAAQLWQLLGHRSVAAPEHAVTAHRNTAETQGSTVGKFGKLLLVGINDGNHLVATNPQLFVMQVLSLYLYVAERFQQIVGQVAGRFFRLARVIAFALTVNVL